MRFPNDFPIYSFCIKELTQLLYLNASMNTNLRICPLHLGTLSSVVRSAGERCWAPVPGLSDTLLSLFVWFSIYFSDRKVIKSLHFDTFFFIDKDDIYCKNLKIKYILSSKMNNFRRRGESYPQEDWHFCGD